MQKPPQESAPTASEPLPLVNAPRPVLSKPPTVFRFSDASIHTHDPRHLLAKMVQTRKQCRRRGLIKRDHTELQLIGARMGITHDNTRTITSMVDELPDDAMILDHLTMQLLGIPVEPEPINMQKKTRVSSRALFALSIWSVSIIIAMLML